MNLQDALANIQSQKSNVSITANQVAELLKDVKGTTFASIVTVTKVKTAAAHKAEEIFKVTQARVQLFNNVSEFTNVYANAVKRSASKIEGNNADDVKQFETQESYFFHTDCYSVVQHKTDESKKYLYAIYNGAESVYVHNDAIISKADAASFCAPSVAKTMLGDSTSHNEHNGVTHSVIVRTIGLDSIVAIKAMKQNLTV